MTRNTHFYARSCRHGLNVTMQRMDGTYEPLPGDIVRFTTRAARNAWVEADPCRDGRATREAVTRAQIAPKIRASARSAYWPMGEPQWDDPEGVGVETLVG